MRLNGCNRTWARTSVGFNPTTVLQQYLLIGFLRYGYFRIREYRILSCRRILVEYPPYQDETGLDAIDYPAWAACHRDLLAG